MEGEFWKGSHYFVTWVNFRSLQMLRLISPQISYWIKQTHTNSSRHFIEIEIDDYLTIARALFRENHNMQWFSLSFKFKTTYWIIFSKGFLLHISDLCDNIHVDRYLSFKYVLHRCPDPRHKKTTDRSIPICKIEVSLNSSLATLLTWHHGRNDKL